MSATLEDTANAPIRYVGSRPLTKEDEEYALNLRMAFQPSTMSECRLTPGNIEVRSNNSFSELSKYKKAFRRR